MQAFLREDEQAPKARGRQRRCAAFARFCLGVMALAIGLGTVGVGAVGNKLQAIPEWWDAKNYESMAAYAEFENPYGKLGVINASGDVLTKDHPFLAPIGANGRACVTCHQPGNAMSVSVDSLRARWEAAGATDPVFAAVDGANCPNLPQDKRSSHSLLLDHGLFRIQRPWPPRDLSGKTIEPDFTIEVVRDPTGCNLDSKYGLKSSTPTISVFRRPRMTANLRFVVADYQEYGNYDTNIIAQKSGRARDRDPETRKFTWLTVLADGGQPNVDRQSVAAADSHLAIAQKMTSAQKAKISEFLQQVFVAQDFSTLAGQLSGDKDAQGLGTGALKDTPSMSYAMREDKPPFKSLDKWSDASAKTPQANFRASVARGYNIYFRRPLNISDVSGFNNIGMGNPYKRTCAICHNEQMSGVDIAPGFMDIGVETLPTADPAPHLPLFKLSCRNPLKPHAFLGTTVFTHDPGRALITGKCADIGSINLSQIRGLAARAPYFTDGSAKDLPALVDYYNTRFTMKLTGQEKADLVNFLSVL